MRFRKLSVTLACLLAVAGCGPEETAEGESPGFDVTDMTLLQSTWWGWATSAPEESNPVSDTTGEFCDHDQPRGVWLLAGSFGETVSRECTVPAGFPLAGPAVNLVSTARTDCEDFMTDADGTVTLDGAELELRTAKPVPVTFETVADNPLTGESGAFNGYACGLWFSVDRIAPGDHTLEIEGSGAGFELSVSYELTVSAV